MIWKGTDELSGSHLPTNADVLQCLMFIHIQGTSPLKEAAALTASKGSEACLSKLNDWGLQSRVRGIVFDTTASNTSLKNGACTFIENSLQQELAWVTFHHHVIELPLAAVFSILFGPMEGLMLPCSGGSSKPDQVFTRQHMKWLAPTCLIVTNWLFENKIVQFCKAALEGLHQRDDYKELLQLGFDLPWF